LVALNSRFPKRLHARDFVFAADDERRACVHGLGLDVEDALFAVGAGTTGLLGYL
jgi:hypothetical protein